MENEYYTVCLDKVISDKTMLSVTRLLAADLQTNPYLTVGQFLQGLSDGDLETLTEVCEDEENRHFPELIIISSLLVQAEGIVEEAIEDDEFVEQLRHRIGALIGFLAIESLHRRGMVKVYYENMSFGEDMGGKVIVERLE